MLMVPLSRAPVLGFLSASLLTVAFSGCLAPDDPGVPQADLGVPLPIELGFAKEVLIDGAHRGGEPSILVDAKNHYYVSAPSGMVSTIFNSAIDPTLLPGQGPQNRQSFIWKSEDEGATWKLLALTPPPAPPVRGDATVGGADTDLAIDACGTIYFTDLWLGNIAVSHTDDGGDTWTGAPITGLQPILDRNWIAAGKDCQTVYLLYQTFYGQLWVLKSTDKGMTFPQQVLVMDCNGTPLAQIDGCYAIDGPIVVDDSTGNLYFVAGLADGKGVWVFASKDQGKTWTAKDVPMKGDINNIFPVIANDQAGNLYVVVSMRHGGSYNVYLTQSSDQGQTWTPVTSVSGPETEGTEVFPWVAAGDAGKVAVVWYGNNETVEKTDDVKGDWFVYMAATEDAWAPDAAWTTAKVSEKPNHKGEICTLGLGCTLPKPAGTRGNRNLADFFEVAIDHSGRAVTTWSDDYSVADDFISNPYFAKQVEGPLFLAPDAPAAP